MKEILIKIFNKYKKIIILAVLGIALIISGNVSWDVYFSKVKIFKANEKKLYETVVKYYEYRKQLLPKKGETRTLTLQDLYIKGIIEDLYIPKTGQTCDVNQSRVRVYQNDNGEYIYNTYLKCGRFESKIDHSGPEITLNGNETIVVAVNSEYEELGIKEVKDDKDGKLDASKVTIDTSELNMQKIGNYKIKYIAYDSSFNKTIVERKVYVRANLTEEVQKNTDSSNYYKGRLADNYILFSGMLWRIVNVNSDGTIKIITDQNISSTNYGGSDQEYKDTNVREWLNNLFYKSLNNVDNYIVADNAWCIDQTDNSNYISNKCTNTIKDKVGMITLSEYNSTMDNGSTWLDESYPYYFMTTNSNGSIYNFRGNTLELAREKLLGVRPVLVLKNNLFVSAGDGTYEKPYKLDDYAYGKSNDMLNTRLIGEYVNYSGMLFIISGFDENKNIKLTSLSTFVDTNSFTINFENFTKYLYDVDNSQSIGYQINETAVDMLDESLIINHEYKVYTYNANKKYNKYKVKKEFKAKVSIPATFDLFSAPTYRAVNNKDYWLMDYVSDDDCFVVNYDRTVTKLSEETQKFKDTKLIIYLSKNAKIKKGKGLMENPFYLK